MFPLDHIEEINRNHAPKQAPEEGTEEYKAVLTFAKSVTIVIQSCNENEYYAALASIEPPDIKTQPALNRAIKYPDADLTIVLGSFAGCTAAIAWTGQGISCQSDLRRVLKCFPNTKAILGLGVAYGMDRKTRFGDVLVAKQITDYSEGRIERGTIVGRGETRNTSEALKKIFCKDRVCWKFRCTVQGREAKAVIGQLVSGPHLLDDNDIKQGIKKQLPNAIGGEMEGWVLYMHIQKEFPNVRAIIIKGVVDYADGTKDKRWQLTAAMAAVHYAHFQMKRNGTTFGQQKVVLPSTWYYIIIPVIFAVILFFWWRGFV